MWVNVRLPFPTASGGSDPGPNLAGREETGAAAETLHSEETSCRVYHLW